MAASSKSLRYGLLTALGAVLCLVAPAPSLEPVFSNDGNSATREIKVCILLLSATSWENPEPFFLPTLSSDTFQRVRNERPASWRLTNPLAPPVVTPQISKLWDKTTGTGNPGEQVTFDGVSATVDNDFEDNGNGTTAAVNANQGDYNGSVANQGGPNTYLAHAQPRHLSLYGANGTSATLALPAIGQPIAKTHPAYWEVPLTPVTVSQLANFDAVFVNTHRNMSFTAQEQTLLRQFLDQGGTLYLEDSHGSRLEVKTGGDPDLPEDVDFFLPFQFVDGYPWSGSAPNRPDGYPVNTGGISTLSPSKYFATPQTAQHPLFQGVTTITAAEADRLGDVRAKDHLIIRSSPANYLIEDLLLTVNSDASWGQPTGVREPAVAVARVGAGKLVLSGIDMIDDCSKPYETGSEPDANILPDIKFMFNLLAWKGSVGGNRRGGVNNQGVGSSQAANSLLPRQVWTYSQNWGGPTASAFNSVHNVGAAGTLNSDPNVLLKEPLCAANGVVYVQYEDGGNYWLCAVDAKPEEDLDGDGQADDGPIRDLSTYGSTADTIWRRDMGTTPIAGATVVSVRHDAAGKPYPIDVLLTTQAISARSIRLRAIHATVDNSINSLAPADTAGNDFYNWTPASGNWGPASSGFVDLSMQGDLDASSVCAPVVYNDLVYVTGTTNFDFDFTLPAGTTDRAPAGEWARVTAVRLVPDPGSGALAGAKAWEFPDRTQFPYGEFEPGSTGSLSGARRFVAGNALKQVDLLQNQAHDYFRLVLAPQDGHPNFIAGLATNNQERQFEDAAAVGTSRFVPTIKDSLSLVPVVGLTRDDRSGLTAPYVFLNRANGDVWAVTADQDALGWKLEVHEEIASPTITIAPSYAPNGVTVIVQGVTTDQPPVITNDSNGWPVKYELSTSTPPATPGIPGAAAFGNLVGTVVIERDRFNPADILSVKVYLEPEYYRAYTIYTECTIGFNLAASGKAVALQRKLYPRERLLRGNRHSGYENTTGAIELLGWSTGAPMLYDATTVVGSSSALWRGVRHPMADYEPGSNAGLDVGGAYQLRSSGMVSFFDASGDDQDPDTRDANQFGALRWAFDTGLLLSQDIRYQIDGNLIASPGDNTLHAHPAPQIVRTASVFGSPVRYGDAVVVAGAVNSPSSGNPDADRGFVAAINPNPVLSAPVVFGATANYRAADEAEYPIYLCGIDPSAITFSNYALESHDNSARPLRQYLVDEGQYRISYRPVTIGGSDRLQPLVQLRGDSAHLFRAAQSVPDITCGAGEEPIPELFRAPLYGRRLFVVTDRNRNGVYEPGTDELGSLYIPSPVQWLYTPDVVHFHPQNDWSFTSATQVSTGLDLSGSLTFDDPTRPLIRFTNAALRGQRVAITYQTTDGLTPRAVTEIQRVPDRIPAFDFSPVVAGDTIYLCGTQLGSLGAPAIPTFDRDGDAVDDNGGIYSFAYGRNDQVIDAEWLRPESLPGWPNFSPTGLQHQYARGVPVAMDDQVFVSFVLDGDGTGGGADSDNLIAPLYALGGRRLLVTEAQRVAEVDYEGRVLTQFTGTKEKIGSERPADIVNNNPVATDLLTTALSRPAKAYNTTGDHVLVVDTGNNRVVEVDQGGLVVWPLDSRTGHPDGVLRFLGLRDLGLERPMDAVRHVIPQIPEHPLRDGNAANAQALVDKTATVIADTGNHRVIMAVSEDNVGAPFYDNVNTQSGAYTYYDPLLATQAGFGAPWLLTAPQVYNPTAQKWVELPYVQLQDWDPTTTDLDARQAATAGGSDRYDRYYVARVSGSDQLFNIDPDPDNDGLFDENNDNEVDGLERNLANMVDQWSGGVVFRGLRYFQRFRVGGTPYLAIVQDDVANAGSSRVVIYEHTNTTPPLTPRWSFTESDYQLQIYDTANANTDAYYRRQGVPQTLRSRWYGSTATNSQKRWDPVSVTKLPNQNLLAIVNGAPNSVNQTSSASEVLLIRFDPNDLTAKRVEHLLPDLATTSTYPAGQVASQTRPSTGSYPVSSPVHVTQ